MIVSNRSTSTIVSDLTDKDFKETTPDQFIYVLKESIKLEGANWMMPSDELTKCIEEQDEGSFLCEKLKQGFGDLLRITKSGNTPTQDLPSELKWSSVKVEDVTAGTYYSLQGGQIHYGPGAKPLEIRTLLFWTFNKKDQKSYDTDFQETKLTLIIGLAKSIWRSLGEDERVKMLFVVFHVFNTCQKAYKETCHTTFSNLELVNNDSRYG